MCDEPASPSGSASDHADCGSDTSECPHCTYWNQDHSTEVSTNNTKYRTSTQHPGRPVKFRFEANLSWGHIRRTVILKWGSLDSALTPAMKTAVKNALKNEVAAAWSNNHLMRITDPICGTKTLPVLARVLWNPDDTSDTHHYTVNLSKAPRTSNVTGSNINLDHDSDLADNAWTLKHEFGHALGLPDEYFYSGVTSATVGYKRADGSTVQVTLEPAAAVMQTRGNTTVKKRYLYTDEIEAQELLRAQSGRSVTCRIV